MINEKNICNRYKELTKQFRECLEFEEKHNKELTLLKKEILKEMDSLESISYEFYIKNR